MNYPLWVSQPGQLSGVGKVVKITETETRATCDCMAAGQSPWARAWAAA